MDRCERGQASVALIATIPLLLVLAVLVARLALAGYAAMSAATSARAGARATLVGADAGQAARRALAPPLRDGARIGSQGGSVKVTLPAPGAFPGSGRIEVSARSSLGPDGGASP